MSEKMTAITLPGLGSGRGIQDWGAHTVADMVAQYRAYAKYQLDWAEKVLAAKDEDFHVELVRGPIVQHHISTLQDGRKL